MDLGGQRNYSSLISNLLHLKWNIWQFQPPSSHCCLWGVCNATRGRPWSMWEKAKPLTKLSEIIVIQQKHDHFGFRSWRCQRWQHFLRPLGRKVEIGRHIEPGHIAMAKALRHIDWEQETHCQFVRAEGLPFGIDLIRTNRILNISLISLELKACVYLMHTFLPFVSYCNCVFWGAMKVFTSWNVLVLRAPQRCRFSVLQPVDGAKEDTAEWCDGPMVASYTPKRVIPLIPDSKIEWNFKKVLLHICILHFIPSIDVMSMMLDSARECTSRGLAQSWEIMRNCRS